MLDKPGYNFPLRSGKTIPRPKTTLPSLQEVVSTLALGSKGACATALMAAAVMKHEDPSTGAGLTGSDSDNSFVTVHGDASNNLSDGKCPPTSFFHNPHSYSVAGIGALTLAASVPDDNALAIQVLGRLLAPPPTMGPTAQFHFPVTFGEAADTLLTLKVPTASKLWMVLQVRVHTCGPDAFVHHLCHIMGHRFSTLEAFTLYSLMKFPVS